MICATRSRPSWCSAVLIWWWCVIYSGTAAQVHAQLINVVPANAPAGWLRVKPGDPAHSWILEKVTRDQPGGSGYGTRMPQGAPNLCQPTVDTLSAWIRAGAPNN